MKHIGTILAILLPVILTGCIEATNAIKVNKDGSGKIVQTVYMGGAAQGMMGMMGGMANKMGEGMDGGEITMQPSMTPSKDDLQQTAAEIGPGVSVESLTELKKADGSKGYRVTFTFADVTKIKLNPVAGEGAGPMQVSSDDEAITFGFTPGDEPVLTVHMPPMEASGTDSLGDDQPGEPEEDANTQVMDDAMGLAMMKQMLAGLHFRCLLMVDGRIVESNATHVQDLKGTERQLVTLLDMDFDEVLTNPAALNKLQKMDDMQDPAAMKEAMKGMKGMKVELEKAVRIRFK